MEKENYSSATNSDLVADVSRNYFNTGDDLDYASLFRPQSSDFLSVSPSSYLSQSVVPHQDMVNRHALCLTRLRQAAREVESLRQENAVLRSINHELNGNLNVLVRSSAFQNHFLSSRYDSSPPLELLNAFRDVCNLGGGGEELCDDQSPTSVIEVQGAGDTDRISLPKSISVRSNAYLKIGQNAAPGASTKTRSLTRPRNTKPLDGSAKVYIRGNGAKKEEEALELEVYSQGVLKTELCNKWQATGACPYGNHCQFAHGVEELRPVIRHPRYKTEVCRMVLAGDVCPYGHRCHFRHAITEQDKVTERINSKPTKLDR
ncbi:Zinc finger CCCH domain-containing protein 15 [Linum grandiflorum]